MLTTKFIFSHKQATANLGQTWRFRQAGTIHNGTIKKLLTKVQTVDFGDDVVPNHSNTSLRKKVKNWKGDGFQSTNSTKNSKECGSIAYCKSLEKKKKKLLKLKLLSLLQSSNSNKLQTLILEITYLVEKPKWKRRKIISILNVKVLKKLRAFIRANSIGVLIFRFSSQYLSNYFHQTKRKRILTAIWPKSCVLNEIRISTGNFICLLIIYILQE
jgi:hypothetical protein